MSATYRGRPVTKLTRDELIEAYTAVSAMLDELLAINRDDDRVDRELQEAIALAQEAARRADVLEQRIKDIALMARIELEPRPSPRKPS